jgi:hypothetical protein
MKAEVEKLGAKVAELNNKIQALQARVSDLEDFGITVLAEGSAGARIEKDGGVTIKPGVSIRKGGGFVPPLSQSAEQSKRRSPRKKPK